MRALAASKAASTGAKTVTPAVERSWSVAPARPMSSMKRLKRPSAAMVSITLRVCAWAGRKPSGSAPPARAAERTWRRFKDGHRFRPWLSGLGPKPTGEIAPVRLRNATDPHRFARVSSRVWDGRVFAGAAYMERMHTSSAPALLWFRQDLRLADNPAPGRGRRPRRCCRSSCWTMRRPAAGRRAAPGAGGCTIRWRRSGRRWRRSARRCCWCAAGPRSSSRPWPMRSGRRRCWPGGSTSPGRGSGTGASRRRWRRRGAGCSWPPPRCCGSRPG